MQMHGACGVCAFRALVNPRHIRKGYGSHLVCVCVCVCVSVTELAAAYMHLIYTLKVRCH